MNEGRQSLDNNWENKSSDDDKRQDFIRDEI